MMNYAYNFKNELNNAAFNGDFAVVKRLVEQGADIHMNDDTPLYNAALSNHFSIVKYLVEHGSKIYTNMIYESLDRQNINIAFYLVKHSKKFTTEYAHIDWAYTLHYLILHSTVYQFRDLIDSGGCSIHNANDYALRYSLLIKRMDMIKYLIQFYEYEELVTIAYYFEHLKFTMFEQYDRMKFHVLLLYRVHNKKIPIELQKIIFQYI